LDKQGGIAPGVARTFEVSPDGMTYTFHLRPDARWSTGARVVAADFVRGLRRLADPATASRYQQFVNVIAHATEIASSNESADHLGVSAPDASTLVVTLSAPAPYFPAMLAHPSTCPIRGSSPAAARSDPGSVPKPLSHGALTASNGAFAVKEWVPGSHISLAPNPYYWNRSSVHLDGVKYLFIPNGNDELTRYRAGGLHITATVSRAQFDWVRSTLGDQLHLSPQLGTYFYGYNLDEPPFKDNPRLRRALSLAVDRTKLTSMILRAGELPAYSWIPPGVNGYTQQSVDSDVLSDPARRLSEARRLYAEAGYSPSNPLKFELSYNNGETHTRLAIAVAAMWKETLGVEVTLRAEEFASLLEDINRGKLAMFRSSWLADYNDAYGFLQAFDSKSGVNLTHYHNPAYDALLAKAQSEPDPNMRKLDLEQAERLMLQDQPTIPLYFYVNKHLVKPQVKGWYDDPLNVVYSKDLSLSASIP
jgi:oligopeptide transport system substrate-binding protein